MAFHQPLHGESPSTSTVRIFFQFQKETSILNYTKYIFGTVNPVINVPNQLIWSTQGNNFTMECNVEAFPRSVNYWIRGDGTFRRSFQSFLLSNFYGFRYAGELIISGSKFGVSEVRDSIFASRMALTVHSFEKSDIGIIIIPVPTRFLITFHQILIRFFSFSFLLFQ